MDRQVAVVVILIVLVGLLVWYVAYLTSPLQAQVADLRTDLRTRIGLVDQHVNAIGMSFDALRLLNPKLDPKLNVYKQPSADGCVAGRGFVFGDGNSIRMLVFDDKVVGVRIVRNASWGWSPAYDQARDKAINGVYSQTIFFKKPPTQEDCDRAGATP